MRWLSRASFADVSLDSGASDPYAPRGSERGQGLEDEILVCSTMQRQMTRRVPSVEPIGDGEVEHSPMAVEHDGKEGEEDQAEDELATLFLPARVR